MRRTGDNNKFPTFIRFIGKWKLPDLLGETLYKLVVPLYYTLALSRKDSSKIATLKKTCLHLKEKANFEANLYNRIVT